MEKAGRIILPDNLSVEHVESENDHLVLFDIYNELVAFDKLIWDRKELSIILLKLTEVSLIHFKREEAYMQYIAFPGLELHKIHHNSLAYKIARFNVNFFSDNPPVPLEIIQFLKAWLIEHVLSFDNVYERYLNKIHDDSAVSKKMDLRNKRIAQVRHVYKKVREMSIKVHKSDD